MNKNKWRNAPIELLALKLCEEAAEVGTEISDMIMSGEIIISDMVRSEIYEYPFTREYELLEELEHVEFLVGIIRERIRER